jgi:hypothetical protein
LFHVEKFKTICAFESPVAMRPAQQNHHQNFRATFASSNAEARGRGLCNLVIHGLKNVGVRRLVFLPQLVTVAAGAFVGSIANAPVLISFMPRPSFSFCPPDTRAALCIRQWAERGPF